MTRRPKKQPAAWKPARRVAKTVKRAKPAKRAKTATRAKPASKTNPAKQAKPHPLDPFIAASARVLELTIDKAWLPEVRSNLEATLHHGAMVASFPLPDETDPAPVFEA